MSWMIWHEITFLFLFVIWKSLQVLQKVRMKIMTCFLHLATFSYTYSPLWLEKRWCDRYFPYQLRPQITVQSYILQDYSSVRISFNMNNKCHILPIVQGFPKSVKDWGKFHTSGGGRELEILLGDIFVSGDGNLRKDFDHSNLFQY